MKICPSCETGNSDNAIRCKDCDCMIMNIEKAADIDYSALIFEEYEAEKGNLVNCTHIILLCLLIPYVFLFVKSLLTSRLLFFHTIITGIGFPYLAYIFMRFPKKMYELMNRFEMQKQRTDKEMTTAFAIKCRLAGIVMLFMIFTYLFITAYI